MEKLIYVVMPGNRYAGLMSYFVQAISNLKLVDNTEHKMYFKYDHIILNNHLRLHKTI